MTEILHPAKRKVISLIGMMGAGKSTTGRNLARRLNIDFNDSDSEIEKLKSKKLTQIFEEEGEEKFKEFEKKIIKQIVEKNKPQVLATGGSVFDEPKNRQILRNQTVTVWLKVDLNTLIERVCRRDTRPILEQEGVDKVQIMTELYEKRLSLYEEADIHIDTTNLTRVDIIEEIIRRLSSFIRNYN
ncbi:shikimate kinase [Pseudomonadota bacterium]